MKVVHNKLVRDKIVKIIEDSGKCANYSILSSYDYLQALVKKDQEELKELMEANANVEEELADKLEVLLAMIKYYGYDFENIVKLASEKREKRGSFDKGIFLIDVE